MSATKHEKALYGDNVKVLLRGEECTVYRIFDESGEMVMTSYQVFPGIDLVYHDAHIQRCRIGNQIPVDLIEISHCREGRMECSFGEHFFYLTAGDVAVRKKEDEKLDFSFPLHHYHGLVIMIDLKRAPQCLSCLLEDVNVEPTAILEQYCKKGKPFVARSKPCLEHIFSELYHVPDAIKKGYFKVKILELFLFLYGMEGDMGEIDKRCYSRAQVKLAKEAAQYLNNHMDSRVTIAELSNYFHVSQTVLKNSFYGVYGIPVYTYIRQQKMEKAALLLKETECSVLEIAGMCGYHNASKFAEAFRRVKGITPANYKRSFDHRF